MVLFVLRLPLLLALTVAIFSALVSPALCSSNVLYSDLGRSILIPFKVLAYGSYTLELGRDCNLGLYNASTTIWQTNTKNKGRLCHLSLQPNGELVLFGYTSSRSHGPIWSSGKTSTNGSYALVLRYDGTLHVYGPSIWSAPDTYTNVPTAAKPAAGGEVVPIGQTDSTLWTDDIAPIGRTISNGDYQLRLHEKCNLTLSNTKTGVVTWSSNTKDKYLQDCFVTVQGDGDLMIKNLGGAPLWSNGVTGAYSNYVLALRPDGKLVVYGPTIWSNVQASRSGKDGKIAMVINTE